VNSIVAIIGAAGSSPSPAGPAHTPIASARAEAPPEPTPQPDGSPISHAAGPASPSPADAVATEEHVAAASDHDPGRQSSSPLVRKIAQEHQVDLSQVPGTGVGGRVTKDDILSFIAAPPEARKSAAARPAAPAASPPGQSPDSGYGLTGQTVPLSVMRRKIAEHMVLSKHTSAHVHTVFEVNFSHVDRIRSTHKSAYEAAGAKLTYLAFIVKAAVDALRAVPVINSSLDANNNVTYHRQVNIGIAVALEWGLIVPVIKAADEKNLLGISKAIADLAERARGKQLKPDDVAGGTFTVTNPGGIGAQFGLPIINQPQVAILGVGAIEKRAVVIDDAIAIRPMGYLSLAFDHRIVDGAVGDHFMALIKHQLEHWNPKDV
jgi:2-oxoglutarate dehydrogenase E2 component (dihydrolipoamide succinyltransferase)